MIAALFRRLVVRCRSRQFSERLSFPPVNHFANGGFHSKTFRQRFCQISSFASRAQNLSGRLIDSRYIRRYWARFLMRAFCENSFVGLKSRFSLRYDSMFLLSIFILYAERNANEGRLEAQ